MCTLKRSLFPWQREAGPGRREEEEPKHSTSYLCRQEERTEGLLVDAESMGPRGPVRQEKRWLGLSLPLIGGQKGLRQAPGACVGDVAPPAHWGHVITRSHGPWGRRDRLEARTTRSPLGLVERPRAEGEPENNPRPRHLCLKIQIPNHVKGPSVTNVAL